MNQLTWVLATARAYLLACLSSSRFEDIAVTLDVSRLGLGPSDIAWLREVPQEHVCCMPIRGGWSTFVDDHRITYYRGDLSRADRYSMHLMRPHVHHYLLPTESAFAVLLDGKGSVYSKNTLYFLDLNDGRLETTVAYIGPDVNDMHSVC